MTAGDPDSYYFQEPAPNGGRIDLGAFGDTHDATPSPAQIVQVLSPSGLEKDQVGQQVTIDWQTAGLTAMGPVALVDAGGAGVDNFGPDQFQTSAGSSDLSFTEAVDTSGVTDPAPQAVYQSYAQAAYGVGNALSYHLAVPNGTYTIRLDFVEPNQSVTAGGRVFDIDLQGTDGADGLRHRGRGRDGVQGDGPDLHGDGQRRQRDQPQPDQRHSDPGGALGHRGLRGQRRRRGQSHRGPPGLARRRDDVDHNRQRADHGHVRARELCVDHPHDRGAGERLPDPRCGRRGEPRSGRLQPAVPDRQ